MKGDFQRNNYSLAGQGSKFQWNPLYHRQQGSGTQYEAEPDNGVVETRTYAQPGAQSEQEQPFQVEQAFQAEQANELEQRFDFSFKPQTELQSRQYLQQLQEYEAQEQLRQQSQQQPRLQSQQMAALQP